MLEACSSWVIIGGGAAGVGSAGGGGTRVTAARGNETS